MFDCLVKIAPPRCLPTGPNTTTLVHAGDAYKSDVSSETKTTAILTDHVPSLLYIRQQDAANLGHRLTPLTAVAPPPPEWLNSYLLPKKMHVLFIIITQCIINTVLL